MTGGLKNGSPSSSASSCIRNVSQSSISCIFHRVSIKHRGSFYTSPRRQYPNEVDSNKGISRKE